MFFAFTSNDISSTLSAPFGDENWLRFLSFVNVKANIKGRIDFYGATYFGSKFMSKIKIIVGFGLSKRLCLI